MRSLDLKLLRDVWGLRGQALAIAVVIAGGVATFVMSHSTIDALRRTQRTFYQESRFATVFCSLKRAPDTLEERIAEIPGVDQVETRVVASVNLEIPGFDDPAVARLLSVPDSGEPRLNRVRLREGRMVDPNHEDEVVASEAFADAHGLHPGARLHAVINGRRETLTLVGIGYSPEFVYQIRPGDVFPDFERYAILWLARRPLAAAYDMDGAFNDVALTLDRSARAADVIDRLDELLARYGGLGAYGREHQLSHRYLSEEFRQLTSMATLFPLIFLSVAAFLLHVVIERLVATQREQLATLKAFGYGNLTIGVHYTKMVLLIVGVGAALGIGAGVWLGHGLSRVYADFFRLPYLDFRLPPATAIGGVAVSAAAALLGTLRAVRRAAGLPPAEAMRPEPPRRFRRTLVERLGLGRLLSQPTRMILRQIERSPLKTLLSMIGIALSVAILMIGSFNEQAIELLTDVQFNLIQRDDIGVDFTEPSSRRALHEIDAIPGVTYAEPYRSVPARLCFAHRSQRTAVLGLPQHGQLRRLLDTHLQPVPLPADGILLTNYLAGMLGVACGDLLTVEVLEGARPVRRVPVVGLVDEFIGLSGYMEIDALNQLMREGPAISGALLAVEPGARQQVCDELKRRPRVAGVTLRQAALASLDATLGDTILIFAFVNTLLAGCIAFGVVYNAARISLSERSRELASLRVLGFSRGEIAYILLGELAILTVAAIPLGFLIGRMLCELVGRGLQSELYRVPVAVAAKTYGMAALVILAAALLSGWIVRRRLDRLDLVAVLKARE